METKQHATEKPMVNNEIKEEIKNKLRQMTMKTEFQKKKKWDVAKPIISRKF